MGAMRKNRIPRAQSSLTKVSIEMDTITVHPLEENPYDDFAPTHFAALYPNGEIRLSGLKYTVGLHVGARPFDLVNGIMMEDLKKGVATPLGYVSGLRAVIRYAGGPKAMTISTLPFREEEEEAIAA